MLPCHPLLLLTSGHIGNPFISLVSTSPPLRPSQPPFTSHSFRFSLSCSKYVLSRLRCPAPVSVDLITWILRQRTGFSEALVYPISFHFSFSGLHYSYVFSTSKSPCISLLFCFRPPCYFSWFSFVVITVTSQVLFPLYKSVISPFLI